MNAPSYETVARFAQQGGTLYFVLMFVVATAYALRPRQKQTAQRLAALPLENNEDDHVRP